MTDEEILKILICECEKIKEKIKFYENKIREEKESRCIHVFKYAGYDHGGRYYKCELCGKYEDE